MVPHFVLLVTPQKERNYATVIIQLFFGCFFRACSQNRINEYNSNGGLIDQYIEIYGIFSSFFYCFAVSGFRRRIWRASGRRPNGAID